MGVADAPLQPGHLQGLLHLHPHPIERRLVGGLLSAELGFMPGDADRFAKPREGPPGYWRQILHNKFHCHLFLGVPHLAVIRAFSWLCSQGSVLKRPEGP